MMTSQRQIRSQAPTPMDLEQMARAYRARVLRGLMVDAIHGSARLLRAAYRTTVRRQVRI